MEPTMKSKQLQTELENRQVALAGLLTQRDAAQSTLNAAQAQIVSGAGDVAALTHVQSTLDALSAAIGKAREEIARVEIELSDAHAAEKRAVKVAALCTIANDCEQSATVFRETYAHALAELERSASAVLAARDAHLSNREAFRRGAREIIPTLETHGNRIGVSELYSDLKDGGAKTEGIELQLTSNPIYGFDGGTFETNEFSDALQLALIQFAHGK
jgi:chromosome segregation ATPase